MFWFVIWVGLYFLVVCFYPVITAQNWSNLIWGCLDEGPVYLYHSGGPHYVHIIFLFTCVSWFRLISISQHTSRQTHETKQEQNVRMAGVRQCLMAPMGAAQFSHRLAACHHTASLISHLLHNIRNTRMHLCSCCNMNSAHEMPGDESTRCSYQLLFVKSLSQ